MNDGLSTLCPCCKHYFADAKEGGLCIGCAQCCYGDEACDQKAIELTRLRAIEAAARAVVESAGTFPSRPLYADIAALRAALEGK